MNRAQKIQEKYGKSKEDAKISGAGKDVEAGGKAIEKAADDTKKKM